MNDAVLPIQLAIADDHVLMRKAIVTMLISFGYSVMIQAANGLELILMLEHAPALPDICILDISMPVMDGYQTITELRQRWPDMKVLVLSMISNEYSVIKMLMEGASGYISKNAEPSEFRAALEDVHAKGFYYSDLVSGRLYSGIKKNKLTLPEISPREKEFMAYCCSDLTYPEIAGRMGVGNRTVDNYRDALFVKLKVKSRTALAIYALEIGITPAY